MFRTDARKLLWTYHCRPMFASLGARTQSRSGSVRTSIAVMRSSITVNHISDVRFSTGRDCNSGRPVKDDGSNYLVGVGEHHGPSGNGRGSAGGQEGSGSGVNP